MYKRFLYLLAAVILIGVGTRVLAAASFTDVVGTPYDVAYEFLKGRGVVQGYADGSGRPYTYLNRAEALKVVLLADPTLAASVERAKKNMPPLPLFLDMHQNLWYAPYVEAAFSSKIITGYPDGSFRGGNLLTVEEAVALLIRGTGSVPRTRTATLSSRIANQSDAWFTPYINVAIQRNLIMDQQILRLGQPITRGQFFDMVYRQMSIREKNIASFQDPVQPASRPVVQQQSIPTGTAIHVAQPQPVSIATAANASEKYFAISMPSLGIQDLSVNHPSDPFSANGVLEPLKLGVGHLFGYPGGGGKVMIYGHSSGYPWDVSQYTKIFRKVNQLKEGDKIYVTYEGKLYTYEVTFEQTIDAKDTTPFNDHGTGEELILYTCWPPDSIAQRYLVHAKNVEAIALR